MYLEFVNPLLEEVEHLYGSLGDRNVNSIEKQAELLGHDHSVEFGAQCAAASLSHSFFSAVKSGSNTQYTEETRS